MLIPSSTSSKCLFEFLIFLYAIATRGSFVGMPGARAATRERKHEREISQESGDQNAQASARSNVFKDDPELIVEVACFSVSTNEGGEEFFFFHAVSMSNYYAFTRSSMCLHAHRELQ